ncbi:twin-arginine translocase TatA/TatE family subunit [Pseudoclavibacter chungangensis]|uniref:Sec-independent protein translocase protein TatA n=1 Tax=Pseudoclavibacter chungangensis TaxID=587635 RepID=A0A7J5C0Q5_9MICO|nr:twin-arginine translocase TatA/TatE family subunit [Pseudoclavibacter chungangensis]KAB1660033.1 twin-arginine translocase TatA/TatE family subunit [Pseudoclavibacter chungangensis]NYJ66875.1 TatA/E family protein of Tat protein translocase [Pseudoclavibacter chungangensis]
MLQNLTGWHALIIVALVLLLFGATKLPALARSVGQSVRILRTEAAQAREEDGAETVPSDAAEARADDVAAHRSQAARRDGEPSRPTTTTTSETAHTPRAVS